MGFGSGLVFGHGLNRGTGFLLGVSLKRNVGGKWVSSICVSGKEMGESKTRCISIVFCEKHRRRKDHMHTGMPKDWAGSGAGEERGKAEGLRTV